MKHLAEAHDKMVKIVNQEFDAAVQNGDHADVIRFAPSPGRTRLKSR